jgi:hypothetical protein
MGCSDHTEICLASQSRVTHVFDPATLLWVAIGIGILAYGCVRIWARYHGTKDSSLGTVSEQWLAERRLNRPD